MAHPRTGERLPSKFISPACCKKSGLLNSEALTVYDFIYTAVDEKPEVRFKCLKRMVGARGFEPPTPWSRTRCQALVKLVDSCCF